MKRDSVTPKKKSFPVAFVFMGLVAVFASWVYFYEFKGRDDREKAKAESAALVPFSNSTVTAIAIRGPAQGGQDISIVKEGGIWKVLKPYSDLGDPAAIESFLSTLSIEKTKEEVVAAADIAWATYGLDKPVVEATLTAQTAQGEKKRSIQIGSVPAYDGSIYARINGENKVVLLDTTVKTGLERDAREFRDKRFFTTPEHPKFTSLEIMHAGGAKLHFVAKDGFWSVPGAGPASWPVDQGAVQAFVQTVAGLRGNEVWAEDKTNKAVLKARGLEHPGTTIAMKSEAGETYEVRIAKLVKNETVAGGMSSGRPQVFSIYKAQLDLLHKSEDDFRDLAFPFQFKIADVRAIELEPAKGQERLPVLARKDGKWIVDPVDLLHQGRDVKPEAVDGLLSQLVALRALKLLPRPTTKPKLATPGALRVGIFGDKSSKLGEFVFAPVGESIHVTSSRAPDRVFEIEKALYDALTLDVFEPVKATPSPKGTP